MVCKPAGGRAANRFRQSGDLLNPGKNFKTRRLEESECKSRGAGGLPRRGLGYEIVTVYRDQGVSGVKISRRSGRPPTGIDFFVLLTAPIPLPHAITHKPLRCSPPRVRRKPAASARLKGSNEVTSDPVGPLLASYVERPGYVMRSRALPPGAGRASTLPPLHLMVEPRHRCARRRLMPAP